MSWTLTGLFLGVASSSVEIEERSEGGGPSEVECTLSDELLLVERLSSLGNSSMVAGSRVLSKSSEEFPC